MAELVGQLLELLAGVLGANYRSHWPLLLMLGLIVGVLVLAFVYS